MKFIRDLIKGNKKASNKRSLAPTPEEMATIIPEMKPAAPVKEAPVIEPRRMTPSPDVQKQAAEIIEQSTNQILKGVEKKTTKAPESAKPASSAVNIWDLDDDTPAAETVAPKAEKAAPEEEPVRSSARQRRNRTRLIGFDKSDGEVVSLFDEKPNTAQVQRVKFPVGWIIVVEGQGRGECFPLTAGMSQIGRGEDQAIQLDFGDNAISRANHAAIVFDPESQTFLLGHGGKANIVRLNDKPVISNEPLANGDQIRIGETTLRLVALCGKDFTWEDNGSEENEDVAIA